MKSSKRKGIGCALLLIAMGIVLLLHNLGALPGRVFDYWPLIFIAWGLSKIVRASEDSH